MTVYPLVPSEVWAAINRAASALVKANAAADAAAADYRNRKAYLVKAASDNTVARIAVRDDLDLADHKAAWAFASQEATRAALTILALTQLGERELLDRGARGWTGPPPTPPQRRPADGS